MARSVENALALLLSLDEEARETLLDEARKAIMKKREVVETVPPASTNVLLVQ
jgi:hypothetical protein